MDLLTGRRNRIPLSQSIRRTLRMIEPHGTEQLAGVEEILGRGNGADRQLRTFNANRDIVEVVRDIADVTERATVAA
jgi:gamma-glutamyl:cysteine ligase YbdK (ATP-grasp superfamily)